MKNLFQQRLRNLRCFELIFDELEHVRVCVLGPLCVCVCCGCACVVWRVGVGVSCEYVRTCLLLLMCVRETERVDNSGKYFSLFPIIA